MTNLMKVTEYRMNRFITGSAPDLRTIKKLIDDGELVGKKIGKIYYIEVDEKLKEYSPIELELMQHG
jgi:predicted dehydrogenase